MGTVPILITNIGSILTSIDSISVNTGYSSFTSLTPSYFFIRNGCFCHLLLLYGLKRSYMLYKGYIRLALNEISHIGYNRTDNMEVEKDES